MNPLKRQAMLVGVLLLLLAAAGAWSVQSMYEQRNAAQLAADDLAGCKQLAASILSLRSGPQIAAAQEMGVQMLGQHIAAASQKARLNPQSLQGVYPQAARRMGSSPYMQKPTILTLQNVALPQLVTFLYHLTEDGSGLSVRDLRLRAPRVEGAGELWDAEATITCLIYQPPAIGHRQP